VSHLENEITWVRFLFHPLSYIRGVSMAHSQESACTYLRGENRVCGGGDGMGGEMRVEEEIWKRVENSR
jgi:hypothetical protein